MEKVTKQDILNEERASNPQPGDYWHEMLIPICVVLVNIGNFVIICDKTREIDENHWTWDLREFSIMTKESFKNSLRYSGHEGYHARVYPEAHYWAVEEYFAIIGAKTLYSESWDIAGNFIFSNYINYDDKVINSFIKILRQRDVTFCS